MYMCWVCVWIQQTSSNTWHRVEYIKERTANFINLDVFVLFVLVICGADVSLSPKQLFHLNKQPHICRPNRINHGYFMPLIITLDDNKSDCCLFVFLRRNLHIWLNMWMSRSPVQRYVFMHLNWIRYVCHSDLNTMILFTVIQVKNRVYIPPCCRWYVSVCFLWPQIPESCLMKTLNHQFVTFALSRFVSLDFINWLRANLLDTMRLSLFLAPQICIHILWALMDRLDLILVRQWLCLYGWEMYTKLKSRMSNSIVSLFH